MPMCLRWTRISYNSGAWNWDADVACDITGSEVGRVSRRPWPNRGFQWGCNALTGTAPNVTEAKRAVLNAYVQTSAP